MCTGVAAQSSHPELACTWVESVPPPWAESTMWRPSPHSMLPCMGPRRGLRTPPPSTARRQACPPPRPADAAVCAQHAWPADMQSHRDSHRAPPRRPVSLKIGPQIKSNQINSPKLPPLPSPPLPPLPPPPHLRNCPPYPPPPSPRCLPPLTSETAPPTPPSLTPKVKGGRLRAIWRKNTWTLRIFRLRCSGGGVQVGASGRAVIGVGVSSGRVQWAVVRDQGRRGSPPKPTRSAAEAEGTTVNGDLGRHNTGGGGVRDATTSIVRRASPGRQASPAVTWSWPRQGVFQGTVIFFLS